MGGKEKKGKGKGKEVHGGKEEGALEKFEVKPIGPARQLSAPA